MQTQISQQLEFGFNLVGFNASVSNRICEKHPEDVGLAIFNDAVSKAFRENALQFCSEYLSTQIDELKADRGTSKTKKDVVAWIFTDYRKKPEPLSFIHTCESLGMDFEAMRKGILFHLTTSGNDFLKSLAEKVKSLQKSNPTAFYIA